MNEIKKMLTLLFLFVTLTAYGQGDYLVKTTTGSSSSVGSEEELFVSNNFPYYSICDLRVGQKFMMVVDDKYGFMPILRSAANNREVSNNKLQYKLLEFEGLDEQEKEGARGTSVSTRFLFDIDGEKYYYEVKNQHASDICVSNPRALIHNLVFLGDVDVARELLIGKTLYTKVTKAQVDDANSSGGSREVNIAQNLEVTVTAVGAGTRERPVKIVFEDRNGNTYFRNVIFSKTNSGLLESDLVGSNLEKYFPNVFSFTDKATKTGEDIRTKYIGCAIYPKRTIQVKKSDGSLQTLLRYTPLVIRDISVTPPNTLATLNLTGKNGTAYTVEADLKYDVFIKNENYIDDLFGYGDLRKQYPNISEESWVLLSKGEVKNGMTKEECRLSLGSPVQIVVNPGSRYESWIYYGRILEFEDGVLLRIR